MDDKYFPILAISILIALTGCSLTGRGPTLPLPEENSATVSIVSSPLPTPRDPFLENLNRVEPLPVVLPTNNEVRPAPKKKPETIADLPVENSVSEENEETYRTSLPEQEAVLAKDLWVRNLLLDRYMENGMKDPFPNSRSSAERRRSAGFGRLNLSDKEQAKLRSRDSVEYVSGLISTWRWFHREMEQLISVPAEERGSPDVFLKNPKYAGKNHQTLRANAAILLGRDGDPAAADKLFAIVRDKSYRIELRCAAVETLGKLPHVNADSLLPLLDLFKEKETEIHNPQTERTMKKTEWGIPELWQETLYALAEKIEPWEHPCFLEPLSSKVYDTRLVTAKLWRMRSKKATLPNDARLPDAFLEHARQEGGELVRIELIKTLGIWKTPDLLNLVGADLHRTAALRGAALDALAEADCREALPMIRQRLRDLEGANRAQAVAALRKLGCYDEVFKMAKDTDSKVRMEVAQVFAVQRNERSLALAKLFLTENDLRLQTATLDAVTRWPIEQQGILLLEAAKSPIPKIRQRAVETLSRHGVEVEGFEPGEKPETQTEKHKELVHRFQKVMAGRDSAFFETDSFDDSSAETSVSPDDPLLRDVRCSLDEWRTKSPNERRFIRDRLLTLGDRLSIYVQYLYETERRNIPASFDAVLAEVDPVFKAIVLLDSEKSADFRRGASELRRLCDIRDIPSLALRRILDRSLRQTDALVLASLLETLSRIDPEAGKTLAETLLDADAAELRRKACDVFAEYGNENDLGRLIDPLYDPNPLVLRAAIEAVVSLAGEPESHGKELAEIERVLRSRLMQEDVAVQIDVAAALHRLGDRTGTEALRRLSASPENGVKIYVAKTLAALEDPDFLPILLWYLDDRNGSVRKAALDALPKLAGEDIGRIEFDNSFSAEQSVTRQRVARWKQWYDQQQESP